MGTFFEETARGRVEIAYRDGVQQGPARVWYPPGGLKGEAYFVEGVLHGRTREFHPDGALAVESRYEYGVRLTRRTFALDGSVVDAEALDAASDEADLVRRLRRDLAWPPSGAAVSLRIPGAGEEASGSGGSARIHSAELVDFFVGTFPEDEPLIMTLLEDADDSTYGLISEVFYWKLAAPRLDRGHRPEVLRVLAAVEELLSRGEEIVIDAVGIRVTPYLLQRLDSYYEDMGPATRVDVRRAMGLPTELA